MARRVAQLMTWFGVTAAAVLAGGIGYVAGRGAPEDVLARSYASSLGDVSTHWQRPEGGHLWLSRAELHPLPLRKAIAVGDHVSIGSGSDRADSYEVVAVETIEADGLGLPGSQIQLVTARPEGTSTGAAVRLIFAVEPPASIPQTVRADKVL